LAASIDNSINFVQNYLLTQQNLSKGKYKVDIKGKAKMDQSEDMYVAVQQEGIHMVKFWEKPPLWWVKCNVDASFLNEEKNGSRGAVIRDHNGNIIYSAWAVIEHCQTAAMGEAIACFGGLKTGPCML
jgi:hypothetical protein